MRKKEKVKKISKVFISMMCIMTMIFNVSCRKQTTTVQGEKDKLSVIATIFPAYDFARQTAKDLADVTMLLPAGMESHSYEPTPKDIIDVSNCDIFIYNGGDSDAWVEDILSAIDTENIEIIKMTDCVETVAEETKEGQQKERKHEHEHDEDEEEMDEHVWTSIRNSITITENICDAFCRKDSKNSAVYKSNSESYINEMKDLDSKYCEVMQRSVRNEIIFGDRFPLRYFARDYNLDYYSAFSGCSSETEASAGTVAFLIDKVKQDDIPVIFYIEFSSHLIADTIADETGAETAMFNTCHNVSKKQIQQGATYVSIMTENLENIEKALTE
jgi:zinc transport system substrate-binding protein